MYVIIRLLFEHTDLNRSTLSALVRTCKDVWKECLVKLDWYTWMRRKAESEFYFLKVASVMYCISSGKHTFAHKCSRGRIQHNTVASARINLEKISNHPLNKCGTFCSCKHIKEKDIGVHYPNLTLRKDNQDQYSEYSWFSATYWCLKFSPISYWMTGYVPDHTNSGDNYNHFLLFGAKPNKECECEKCKTKQW